MYANKDCACSLEPSLLANAISNKISGARSFHSHSLTRIFDGCSILVANGQLFFSERMVNCFFQAQSIRLVSIFAVRRCQLCVICFFSADMVHALIRVGNPV